MKKLFLSILVAGLLLSGNAYALLGDIYSSSSSHIEIEVGGGPPQDAIKDQRITDTAIEHCSEVKKKTYYIFRKGFWGGFPSKLDPSINWPVFQYHNKSEASTIKLFCSNDKDQAIVQAKNSIWEGGVKKKQRKLEIGFKEFPIRLSKKDKEIAKKKAENGC